MRSFLALELGPIIQGRLQEVSLVLKKQAALPVRWVAGKNIHLTVKFLGESEAQHLEDLQQALITRLAHYEPFEMRVGGLGAFPPGKSPRVIWVGVQAPPELEKLVGEIEEVAAGLGFERERRKFSPHLTLGRVASDASPQQAKTLLEILTKTQVGELGVVPVNAVHLIKSVLTPGGPIYSTLAVMGFSC